MKIIYEEQPNAKPVKKLRVAAYCRVSTKMELQQFSLGQQKEHYETWINQNYDWEFAGIYIDVASGTTRHKREQFNAMIRKCMKGRIDLILVKSISRFGRNVVDVLNVLRRLKLKGVDVYFENEHIYLQQLDSELTIALIAAVAQEESMSKSRNIKWGFEVGFQTGYSQVANKSCYGYDKDSNGKLIIHSFQADIVRQIFDWYLQGDSLSKISGKLYDMRAPSPTGKEKWTSGTINKLLSNEKYTGDVLLQKTYISDFWNHKQSENNGKYPQYLFENNHPAIIPKDVFELVQKEKICRTNVEVNNKSKTVRKSTRYSSKSSLSGKIRCSFCGKNYRRITTHTGEIVWRCAGRVEKQKEKCQSSSIKQSDILHRINLMTNIIDLYLDFLFDIVEKITVYENDYEILLKEISSEYKTELLHKQDHWLAHHYMNGDKKAGDVLYTQHKPFLDKNLNYLKYRSSLNEADIEDLTQIIWLRIFSRISNYNSKYRFWTWMKQIIRSEFRLAVIRQQKDLVSGKYVDIALDDYQYRNRNNIDEWISNDYVDTLLSVLTAQEREIVVRYLLNSETQASISNEMKLSTSRISQIYLGALKKMKTYL